MTDTLYRETQRLTKNETIQPGPYHQDQAYQPKKIDKFSDKIIENHGK
jgi:hypothetical protein